MSKERFAELRAGIFTVIILIGFAVMVFVLGSNKGYFKQQITLKAKFLNVYGLQIGAPVRFMGVGIGRVTEVILPNQSPCSGIEVLFQVDKSVKKNITKDSVATIKWLSYVTGDSYVEITSGECQGPEVEDGDTIKSAEPINYTSALENGVNATNSFSNLLKKLDEGNFIESLNNISVSLNDSVKAFQTGNGLLHALVYDPKGKQLMDNLATASESLKGIPSLIESLNKASVTINESLLAFQNGNGLLHTLIYDPKGEQLFNNLFTTSESLKGIMAEVEKGEGTIGALIADPTLYDNLKSLLGGAERSFLLRSMIRKSIEKGKKEK